MSRDDRPAGCGVRGAAWALAPLLLLLGAGMVPAEDPPAQAEAAAAPLQVFAPEIILASQKPPEFPPAALAGRFSGTVTLEAVVQRDGSVGDVRIVACTAPNLGFEQASIDAVKQWRFEPARQGTDPVEFELKFRLNFRGSGRNPHVTAGTFTSQESPTSHVDPSTPSGASSAPKPN